MIVKFTTFEEGVDPKRFKDVFGGTSSIKVTSLSLQLAPQPDVLAYALTCVKPPLPLNTSRPAAGAPPRKFTEVRTLFANARQPMLVTVDGIVNVVRALSANAEFEMVVTEFGMVSVFRRLYRNAPS